MRYLFDNPETIFSLVEEAAFFRLRVETHEIKDDHVEEFTDKTVEWLSSNPNKGILIDFEGVKRVCTDFTVALTNYYEDIKSRGLYVRFVNVEPAIQPYIDVQNITLVMTLPEKPVLSAKALLQDLAANVHDRDLMKKYGLSPRGLNSMYKKMLRKGLISRKTLSKRMGIATAEITVVLEGRAQKVTVEASNVLKDIADEKSDVEIMQKYRLSPKGLGSLMRKLFRKGLVSKETLIRRKQLFGDLEPSE